MRTLVWIGVLVVAAGAVFLLVRGLGDEPSGVGEIVPDERAPRERPVDTPAEPELHGRLSTEPDTVPGAAPVDASAGQGLVVTGSLEDPKGRPASRVDVAVEAENLPTIGGATDGEGRFRLLLAWPTPKTHLPATLRANQGAESGLFHVFIIGRAGFESKEPHDLGTLRLLEGVALEVALRLPEGARVPATVWIASVGGWLGPSGTYAQAETDEADRARFALVPYGSWRVVATAEGAGRGDLVLKLPRSEGNSVELELPPERIARVAVIDRDTEAPIEGARVELHETVRVPGAAYVTSVAWPWPIEATDASGVTRIRGLPPGGSFRISAQADGYPQVQSRATTKGLGVARLAEGETEVVVQLAQGRTIRWPIAAGEVPVPTDGTEVSLGGAPGTHAQDLPSSGVVVGGHLEVGGCGPQHFGALAVLPDGAMARLWATPDEDTGPEIRFSRPRSIQVTLTYPDGAPATGYYVKVANQGNNALGDAVAVDEAGRAKIEGLYADPARKTLVEVRIATDAQLWGGFTIASVDISAGDREVSGVVPRTRPVTILIRRRGKRGLPEGTQVSTALMGRNPGLVVGVSGTYAKPDQVDLATGEVHLDWQPIPGATEGRLRVDLVGYVPHNEAFPIPPGDTPLSFEVDLEAAGAIDVVVKPPEDGRTRINLERWVADKDEWTRVHLRQMAMGGFARPDPNGDLRLEPLTTGRYRVIDTINQAMTEPIEVVAGGDPPRVVLDVSKSGWIRGRVEVPSGYDPRSVRVLAEGLESLAPGWQPQGAAGVPDVAFAACQQNGEFWLRVPGDVEVTLRPVATGLEPAADGGTLTARNPQDGVVLRLVEGRVARVHFTKSLRTYGPTPLPGVSHVVRLYRGEPEGEGVHVLRGDVSNEGREMSFSGFAPGTWTVWIDADPYVPVVLRNVELGEGTTDLGEVEVTEGLEILIDVVLAPDQDLPRLYAGATKQGEPTYTRRMGRSEGSTLRVSGLGKGTFEVYVGSHMGSGPSLKETVELTGGKEEVRLTLDTR